MKITVKFVTVTVKKWNYVTVTKKLVMSLPVRYQKKVTIIVL